MNLSVAVSELRGYNRGKLSQVVFFVKKLFFVMNPCAGMKKANKLLPEMFSVFNRAGCDVIVHITEARGDAEEVVTQRAAEMDLVVCSGGDGTFNETVSGILRSGTDVPIGYIPAGSTNDFAGSLALQSDPVEAAREIVEGEPQPFDLGRFNDRYFSYVASFGAFSRASYATPQSMKNALGHMAYLLSGIQELSQIRAVNVKAEVDGQIAEGAYIFGAICNCTSMGGVISLDPELVDLRDGKFEIFLIRAPKDLAELGECILALQQQQYKCKMMTFLSGSHIRIEMEEPVSWSLDGERAEGGCVIEAENLHHAYKLIKRVKEQ